MTLFCFIDSAIIPTILYNMKQFLHEITLKPMQRSSFAHLIIHIGMWEYYVEAYSMVEYIWHITVTCQKFKYNFTHFTDCHVISAICYTVYSKDSLFISLKIAVIKHRVILKSNHMLVII